MAVCKRPAAAVLKARHHQAHALKKRRVVVVVVARRTCPGPITVKKPAAYAYATTADYEEDNTPCPCLAEAASGVVYKARHRFTGHNVAIKFPSSSLLAGEQLLREARLLEAACDGNRHVVSFNGFVRAPATAKIGLVMEFVTGGQSLRDILRERRTPLLVEATVRAFVQQLLEGAKGVHDRDIRPANILVTAGDGEVLKIFGFGLAISETESEPSRHGNAGNMLYAAPEVLMGKPDPDAWSIGCVMAKLVGGGEVLLRRGGVDDALLHHLQEEIANHVTTFGVLGTPDHVKWPRFASLPCAANMPTLTAETGTAQQEQDA